MMLNHPLRARAEALYGSVKAARGEGLYFANGQIIRATQSDARLFADWADVERNDLGRSLGRLSERDIAGAELALFEQGVRQLELRAPASAWRTYERSIRELCAVCLREKRGGGALYACWAAMRMSMKEDIS